MTGESLEFIKTGQFTGVNTNTTYYPDYSSIIWDVENGDDGDRIKYVGYESDGGSTTTINVTLSYTIGDPSTGLGTVSATIPITINNGDDFNGETIAVYCHDIDPVYYPQVGDGF